jgi:DNA-directed RNA polymerase II subunit RPB1
MRSLVRSVTSSGVYVPRTDPSKSHYLPVNLHRIVQNAIQIFHIDRRKPSDLEPAYVINAVRELTKRLIIV